MTREGRAEAVDQCGNFMRPSRFANLRSVRKSLKAAIHLARVRCCPSLFALLEPARRVLVVACLAWQSCEKLGLTRASRIFV